jgi:hypothetical protein
MGDDVSVYHCDHPKAPGESIEIGDMLGHGLEPNLIIGRVCGYVKDSAGEFSGVLFRRYRSHTERWPSGDVCSRPFVVAWPHMHLPDSSCQRFIT